MSHGRGPKLWLACLLLSACNSPGAGTADPVAPAATPTARGGEPEELAGDHPWSEDRAAAWWLEHHSEPTEEGD